MNAEAFVTLYDRVADAPDAIARLRRFVLDLAMSGRLSPTRADWIKTRLGDIGEWGSGGTPSRTNPDYYGGNIPWLVIGDLNDSTVTSAATHITEQGLLNSSAKLVAPGTVLIAMYGSIGKLGIAGITCATNQAIAHCSPDTRTTSANFLFLLLRSLRQEFLASGKGVAQQNISQKVLKAWPIKLPPLAEQQRIVAKVDELMALLDRMEAARSAREATRDRFTNASLTRLTAPDTDPEARRTHGRFVLDNLPALSTRADQIKQLRQTILELAVRGKLVEQHPGDEPASTALQKHYSSKSSAGAGKRSLPKQEAASGKPTLQAFVPPGWEWTTLGEVGDWGSGSTPSRSQADYYGGGYTWLKSGELGDSTALSGSEETVSERALRECSFRRNQAGDVLIAMYGATIGKLAILAEPAVTNQAVCGCTPYPFLLNRYLFLFLLSNRSSFQAASEGGAQPNISKMKIVNTAIPLPPVAEQHRIVAKVDELMALCDRLEAALRSTDTTRARLLEALLHEALASETTERKAA